MRIAAASDVFIDFELAAVGREAMSLGFPWAEKRPVCQQSYTRGQKCSLIAYP